MQCNNAMFFPYLSFFLLMITIHEQVLDHTGDRQTEKWQVGAEQSKPVSQRGCAIRQLHPLCSMTQTILLRNWIVACRRTVIISCGSHSCNYLVAQPKIACGRLAINSGRELWNKFSTCCGDRAGWRSGNGRFWARTSAGILLTSFVVYPSPPRQMPGQCLDQATHASLNKLQTLSTRQDITTSQLYCSVR
jgi:hypothetical protein